MNWGPSANSNKLFIFLYVIKRLSVIGDWQIFLANITDYEHQHGCFTSNDYGFPDNWREIL